MSVYAEKIPVYIGYDKVESGAFWTCAASIMENSSKPVEIIPLKNSQLPLNRARHPKQSNDFAFTRWLVPYLQNYSGYGIFVDCDFLFMGDIAELWYLRDPQYAVQVCKHSGETFKAGKKYLGTEQTVYDKKCWSSLMLFNCEHPNARRLTPWYIDQADGLDLHQFKWCYEEEIGSLPLEWNWLIGHYPPKPDLKAVHYTEGGPYFKDYKDCNYSAEWWHAFGRMKFVKEGLT
jgi:lipopolysaccharide biosynthesis glycosyltransferase